MEVAPRVPWPVSASCAILEAASRWGAKVVCEHHGEHQKKVLEGKNNGRLRVVRLLAAFISFVIFFAYPISL